MNVYLAEFIGTAFLILLGDGVVANVILAKTKGNNSGWIVITIGWATAVLIGALMFGPVSGGHFNPALTIGLAAAGKFAVGNVLGYVLAQFAGAFTGAVVVWLMYRDHLNQTPDPATQLGVFCTGPAIRSYGSNFINELIGTFVLTFTLAGVGAGYPANDGTSIGIWSVWAVILAVGVSLGGTTGYAINPARDLAPRIAHAMLPMKGKGSSDWGYAWVPVAGPLAGGILGAVLGGKLFG